MQERQVMEMGTILSTGQLMPEPIPKQCPPPPRPLRPAFPLVLLLSMTSHGMEHLFGQLGSAVPAVSSPSVLCTSSLLSGGVVCEAEKALTLCEHCSAITKTSL